MTQTPDFRERRKHGRAGIRMEAVLQGERPEDDVQLSVMNFSVGGFFCRISRPIEPMTRLGITFQFPPFAEHAPRRIDATALVVRCEEPASAGEPWRLAACFLELDPAAREHIQGYVDWHELIYGGDDSANLQPPSSHRGTDPLSND